MRAAVLDHYGPPEAVHIREIPTPTPGPGEILIRVAYATITSGDARVRGFNLPRPIFWLPAKLMLGFKGPRQKVLGVECAGYIHEVGQGVTNFKPGDPVFTHPGFSKDLGTHAEYVLVDKDTPVEHIPANLTMPQAAAIGFGAITAIYYLEQLGKLQPNQRLMIIGASGAVGLAAINLAKHLGAHVTAVCSARNTDLVRSAGADEVIDYTTTDYTDPASAGEPYDAVLDTVGATRVTRCKRILKPTGTFLACIMGFDEIWRMLLARLIPGPRVKAGIAEETPAIHKRLVELIDQGAFDPVIDREYGFDEIVEAYRYVDTWRKRGNVVLKFADDADG
ncbi:MAG: NAD(P)-dependent alcohol dehydrogenase [Phycisphaera sp.]|nr:MAG: NAD(P)-dependent alcohol dehydrogenase [Phycisphaera sp.]